jgi:hypothetical protein
MNTTNSHLIINESVPGAVNRNTRYNENNSRALYSTEEITDLLCRFQIA